MLNDTFFINDLSNLPKNEVGLAVLGCPVKHSISPKLHNAALAILAEKESTFRLWNYRKIEVLPSDLPSALSKLSEFGFRGLNLTIPHKVDVLPLISSMDEQARAMGAVNTLNLEKGVWRGYNTDGVGLSRAIFQAFKKQMDEFNILILGAGGAARAAVAQSIFEGCRRVAVFNRSVDRARELCQALKNNGIYQDIDLLESIKNPFSGSQEPTLVINATSLGLQLDDPSPIDLSLLSGNVYVFDMVYNPPVTSLLRQANEMEYPSVNGLGMLVGQAAKSLEIWSDREVSTEAMSQAVQT
jgi:shikimate dehydrogenase